MSDEAEQIGDLVYVPNPEYPYPFPVEPPPHFWMTEQSGRLEESVDAYFNGERLQEEHLNIIKQYLRQYIERAVLPGDAQRHKLLTRVEKLRNTRDIERFADELSEVGVEPF
ncbi:MAG: hypothetical protein HC828_01070 [Blastochloris sp.]|nr:hypothetical protein [Blastochloris sp.]